jgi:hypothetical protein
LLRKNKKSHFQIKENNKHRTDVVKFEQNASKEGQIFLCRLIIFGG